ncbi:diguanylate cyclase [Halothiobacillus diazotrophicus]|uniref:Diguanylate cyclase n=1 Tax=Halothiobacillus diazotrophicus TaxID=1860122 RepID=A0A191ZGH5_9GAMM|nr:GGDEF domain-containing protein [Halothiobacillus diazotrophicus]ANJ66986.1 diguanylate cyclase [Halothiobacillus diazotrophicus]
MNLGITSVPPDILDHLPVCVVIVNRDTVVYANPAAQKLFEAANPEEILGHSINEFIHPLDQQRVLARVRRAEEGPYTNPPTEYRIYTCKRNLVVIGMTSTTYIFQGEISLLAAFMDMTERTAMEARLRETDEQFQRMMNTMQDVFYRTDAEGITRYVCPAVKQVLGFSAEEIMGRPAADFYPDPSDRQVLKEAILREGFVRDFPGQMRRKDGKIIDISISSTVILDEEGKYAGVEGIWRDITERRNLERELERRATTDELTGIANRRTILEQLDYAHKRYLRYRHPLVLFILDLDFFKRINDQHGHIAGDRLLVQLVECVQHQLREIDQCGRLGGEEFIVILDETSVEQAQEIGTRILQTVRNRAFDIGIDAPIHITASIGATCALLSDRTISHLMERADNALYAAKDSGRDRICWN